MLRNVIFYLTSTAKKMACTFPFHRITSRCTYYTYTRLPDHCVYQTYGKMEYFLTSLHLTRLNRTLGTALGNTRYCFYSNYASQF